MKRSPVAYSSPVSRLKFTRDVLVSPHSWFHSAELTEERKHAIPFSATLLSARKLIELMDSGKANFARSILWILVRVAQAAVAGSPAGHPIWAIRLAAARPSGD
jgi:hypothetical protein